MSKTCKYCGGTLNEGDSFCQKCGAVADQGETTPSASAQAFNGGDGVNNNQSQVTSSAKTSGAAIGSFVCSLVGLFFAGIILGIVSISLSAASKKQIAAGEKGKGLATAGLVIGILDIIFAAIAVVFNAVTLTSLFS